MIKIIKSVFLNEYYWFAVLGMFIGVGYKSYKNLLLGLPFIYLAWITLELIFYKEPKEEIK